MVIGRFHLYFDARVYTRETFAASQPGKGSPLIIFPPLFLYFNISFLFISYIFL